MILINLAIFIIALFVVIKSSEYCIRYSSRIAKTFHLSEFIVSFLIIAIISTFPEASIAILSALQGDPSFGMGALLGSNVADLTLVFGIVVLFSYKGIRIKSEIVKRDFSYLLLLLFPILLGLDGRFTRMDGLILILGGFFFFLTLSLESKMFHRKFESLRDPSLVKNSSLMLLAIAALLVSAHFTMKYGTLFAYDLNVPPLLIGLTMVSVGTCLPELLYSLRAVSTKHDELALGDLLGTVIMDATIVLGIVVLISPFTFNPALIYVTGFAMFFAGLMVVSFIRYGKIITKKEGILLLFCYLAFVILEFIVNRA